MTELIQKQLVVIIVMGYCGLTSGLIMETFRLFNQTFFNENKVAKAIMKIFCVAVIAFLIGEFSFYCQNGKLTIVGAALFFAGLWLWRKFFVV